MSLALVAMPVSEFQRLHDHLMTYKPNHQNMHLREARYVRDPDCEEKKRRVLRYLHAMHANGSGGIEGMIAGPGVFWHYKLTLVKNQTQMDVLVRSGSPKDEARMGRRFLPEIMKRMRQEQARTEDTFPKLKRGEFYLRRSLPGMAATHANCRRAVSRRVLDQRFVSQLHAWNLILLHPA